MKEYGKIGTLFFRDPETKKLDPEKFNDPAVYYLKDCNWTFTEKIDGTNIRIVWDGYRVSILGRTDNASIPPKLLNYLQQTFGGSENEQLFEQKFGLKQVVLYGEGYGAGIQSGGKYRKDNGFILFDVEINDLFLSYANMCDVADYFQVPHVPLALIGTIQQGIDFVKARPDSQVSEEKLTIEGIVGVPQPGLYDRRGNRIMVKIKVRDLDELARNQKEKEKHHA